MGAGLKRAKAAAKATKKKLTADPIRKQIRAFEKEAERLVGILADTRDELRALVEKYSDLLDDVEYGIEDTETALTTFEHAIDRMSGQI